MIHKSVGYYFAGGLVFILLNSDKVEIYAFGSGYIVATHFVTSRAILVEGIRLMSLNGTVNHLHVVAHLKGKESRIRNTVGLICAPLIDYTVTVSVDFDCHILTIDNVLNIIERCIRSLHVHATVVVAIVVFVARVLLLGIGSDCSYDSVSDTDRLVIYGIDRYFSYLRIIVLYRGRWVDVAVFVNEEHFLFINTAVCVIAVANIDLILRALYFYHTRFVKRHANICLPLGKRHTVGDCDVLSRLVGCNGKNVYGTVRAVSPTYSIVCENEGRTLPVSIRFYRDGFVDSPYVICCICRPFDRKPKVVCGVVCSAYCDRIIGNAVADSAVVSVSYNRYVLAHTARGTKLSVDCLGTGDLHKAVAVAERGYRTHGCQNLVTYRAILARGKTAFGTGRRDVGRKGLDVTESGNSLLCYEYLAILRAYFTHRKTRCCASRGYRLERYYTLIGMLV